MATLYTCGDRSSRIPASLQPTPASLPHKCHECMLRSARDEEAVYRNEFKDEMSKTETQIRIFTIRMGNGHGTPDTVVKLGEKVARLEELKADLDEMVMEAWAPFREVWGAF